VYKGSNDIYRFETVMAREENSYSLKRKEQGQRFKSEKNKKMPRHPFKMVPGLGGSPVTEGMLGKNPSRPTAPDLGGSPAAEDGRSEF